VVWQTVEGLGDNGHGAVEADAVLGDRQVVVDGLGKTDHGFAAFNEMGRNPERPVATNRHQSVDRVAPQVPDHLLATAIALEGIVARAGAQDRAS